MTTCASLAGLTLQKLRNGDLTSSCRWIGSLLLVSSKAFFPGSSFLSRPLESFSPFSLAPLNFLCLSNSLRSFGSLMVTFVWIFSSILEFCLFFSSNFFFKTSISFLKALYFSSLWFFCNLKCCLYFWWSRSALVTCRILKASFLTIIARERWSFRGLNMSLAWSGRSFPMGFTATLVALQRVHWLFATVFGKHCWQKRHLQEERNILGKWKSVRYCIFNLQIFIPDIVHLPCAPVAGNPEQLLLEVDGRRLWSCHCDVICDC